MDIGDQIYKARLSAGMKQGQLAKAIGRGKSAVNMMENNKYEFHAIKLLEDIAKATDHKLMVMFYRE
jgi:transcriptional regulator with XRE-family HTH domain